MHVFLIDQWFRMRGERRGWKKIEREERRARECVCVGGGVKRERERERERERDRQTDRQTETDR